MEPDWPLLPPELVQLISGKLPSIVDYVRFRAVCPAWRSAASPRPLHLPPQLPWLIFSNSRQGNMDGEYVNRGSSLSMYDLSQSKTHTLHLPEIEGKRICGSSHGWIVLERLREVSLLNPITRDQISRPSLLAQPKFYQGDHPNCKVLNCRIKKAILSSNPRMDPNCIVMALFSSPRKTAFCRIGDDCWTVLTVGRERLPQYVVDIAYHNDLFYAIYCNGHAWKCDIRNPFSKHIGSTLGTNDGANGEDEIDTMFAVEGGCDEHGLMIFSWNRRYDHRQCDIVHTFPIDMLSDEQEIWLNAEEELKSRYCFFWGVNFHCISLPIANLQLHGWEGNWICYASPHLEKTINGCSWYSCSIKLNKGNDGTVTTLASHLGSFIWSTSRNLPKEPYFLWHLPTLC